MEAMEVSENNNNGIVARPYQLRLLDHAIKHNSIIYLPTGSGKTYIAIMLIRHFSKDVTKPISEGGKRCVFLCNTVELSRQVVKEIATTTNFKVGLFIGDMNVDNWPQERWTEEINTNQVFVGTSQVFVDMVSHRYLSISDLSCVIIDECHHATKSHPMHVFLSLFTAVDPNQRPRTVGLTGVLLKSIKGDILKPLNDMEAAFRGKIITVENMDEFHNVLLYSTKPDERMLTYSETARTFDVEGQIKEIILKCCSEIDNWNLGEMRKSKNLESSRDPSKLKQIKLILSDFEYQMGDMGLYAASLAILSVIIKLEVNKRNSETMMLRSMYRYVITQCERIRHILVKKIGSLIDDDDDDDDMDEADVILNFSKPKLQALLMFLLQEFASKKGADISCLVFVKRRYTARCLYLLIKHFVAANSMLSHIVPEFMVGRNSGMSFSVDTVLDSKWNRKAVEKFRQKECNLIVCSSVLEEGIDVQACNYVIAFDPILHFSSYVQMKGRARAVGSTYLVTCELLKKFEVAEKIDKYRKVDALLKEYLITRTIDREIPDESRTLEQFQDVIEPFKTPTGAVLKSASVLMLLHRYCQILPHDAFTPSAPIWNMLQHDLGNVKVSLQLPSPSTIKTIIESDVMKTCKLAKVSAAFKACVQLYLNGELTENLLPMTRKDALENVSNVYFSKWNQTANEPTAEDGSKKKVRTYKKEYPEELVSGLPKPGELCFAYCISIKAEFKEDEYSKHIIDLLQSDSSYAIILKNKIPVLAQMPLFMSQGALSVEINNVPFEFAFNSDDELLKLKKFNKMLFCDIRSLWNNFLAIDNANGPNSFLIAPVKNNSSIDWTVVYNFQHLNPTRATTEAERQKQVHKPEDYLGKIVNTWYSSRDETRYVVTKVRRDLTPMSDFVSINYKNFAAYVKDKYEVNVVQPQQFMIEARKLTSRTNFFVNSAGKLSETKRKRSENTDILIPEMCHNFRFPGDLWLKSLLIPSILHRFHYLLFAEKIRLDVNRYLEIVTPSDYRPAPIQIDYSLGRVQNENDIKEPPTMLPALSTTREDKSLKLSQQLVNVEDGNWKSFIEPIDIERNALAVYPIEVDYYYQFVNNLLVDMEKLNLEQIPDQQSSICQLEAHKPKIEHFAARSSQARQIADACFDNGRRIRLLDLNPAKVKTAEQYEFLAAITAAAANDVFDMERFEVLGDSFLKFSVSLLLMHRHLSWNEGFLTAIKSRMVSNRNLFYCFLAKFPGSMVCSSKFEPRDEWLPPSASVPKNVLQAIEKDELSANCLLDLELTSDEIDSGNCSEQTLSDLYGKSTYNNPTDCFNEFLYKQAIRDKVLSDCVEALLGVCVKNYGVEKSFEMLDYFGIFYDREKKILPNLLQINLGSPLVKTNISQSDVDAYLTNYEFVEKNLGYKFNDRAYLLQALTHPSFPTNQLTGCYQQLEFIGDAILDFLISCYIFENCTHMNPGQITDLRSALVNNITLACVCVRNRFHQFMLYESPPLNDSIKKFVEFQNTQDHQVTDQVKILLEETSTATESFNMAQNIDVPKALGDVMEALIGAIFLDSGNNLQMTWKVISHLMEIELNEFLAEVPIDPVRQLYEYRGANPTFQIYCIETDVVMMQCTFYCRDLLKTVIGCGGNKLMAKKAAAKMALQILLGN